MNASPLLAVMPEEPDTYGLSRRPPVKARLGMDFQTLERLYQRPLFELITQSREVHLQHGRSGAIECCGMPSRKQGAGSGDESGTERAGVHSIPEIIRVAEAAHARGASRFCLGAGWSEARDGTQEFEELLLVAHEVSSFGMEVCVTLENVGPIESAKLRKAGVTAYGHHAATSGAFGNSEQSGARAKRALVCADGMLAMDETVNDRLRRIEALCQMTPPPESVSIRCLGGTLAAPLAEKTSVNVFELVRLIAVARLALPGTRLRLAAGRRNLSREGQALCFFAGANSIFLGDRWRTPADPQSDSDLALLRELGLPVEKPSPTRAATPSPAIAPMVPKPRKRYVEPPPGSLTEILTRLAVSTQLAPGVSSH